MLRITFTPPDGGPVKQFEFENIEDKLGMLEAELVEDSGGRQWTTYMEWAMRLTEGSLRACRVLLWVLLRRDDPTLELASLDFPVSALVFETDDDEDEATPATPVEPVGKDEPDDSDTSSQ